MAMLTNIIDGLANVLTGRGTSVDRQTHSFWQYTEMTQQQIEAAYCSSWLVRKIVDLPANDMTREWRTWKLKPDEVKRIEEAEAALNLHDAILEGLAYGRLGGGAVLLGGKYNLDEPMRPGEEITYAVALNRWQVGLGEIDWNPLSPTFRQPSYFTLPSGTGMKDEVHPSRMLLFKGQRIPGLAATAFTERQFWGMSIVEVVDRAVRDVDQATGGFAGLIDEAKIDVFKLSGLADLIISGAEGEAKAIRRVELANQGKSNMRALVMDAEDEWSQKQISWSGIPDIIKTYLMIAAGAADIPATRLYGKAPDGQNSTGESDDRNYRSAIMTEQRRALAPALRRIDAQLLPSLNIDADAYWSFSPLSTLTKKEQSEIDKADAETAKVWQSTGLVPHVALAKGVQSKLVEEGTYPALEDELEKTPEAALVPDPEANASQPVDPSALSQSQTDPAGQTQMTALDAAPRSLYVRRDVLNGEDIVRWAKSQGFDQVTSPETMHVTLAYSELPIDWMTIPSEDWAEGDDGSLLVKPGGVRIVERFPGGPVVLLFTSSALSYRHERIKAAGAAWKHDEYQPHITLTWGENAPDLSRVVPYRGPIKLGPEIFEETGNDWEPEEG